jgi:transcription termination factor Rho
VVPSSGKVLSGCLEATALTKPRQFFATARNIEEGGSITSIATALIDTGSRMDEVIFEEFKGTGKEALLLSTAELDKVWVLRKALQPLGVTGAVEFLSEKMRGTTPNKDCMETMKVQDAHAS